MEEEAWRTDHLGGTWHQGDTQERPGRHPGGTQESPRGNPGGSQEHQEARGRPERPWEQCLPNHRSFTIRNEKQEYFAPNIFAKGDQMGKVENEVYTKI